MHEQEAWEAVGAVAEGELIRVQGINPWGFEWQRLPEPLVELPQPDKPGKNVKAAIYEVETVGKRITFAAGELPGGIWAFYIPATKS